MSDTVRTTHEIQRALAAARPTPVAAPRACPMGSEAEPERGRGARDPSLDEVAVPAVKP